MALPSAPEEKEYGAVQAEEALQAAAPPPLEPTPTQEDEKAMADVQDVVAQAAPVEQPAQQEAPAQQKPNMWRIPHRYNQVLGTQQKPALQAIEDIGLFWNVLAASPRVDPSVKAIARAIMGERNES